jgi:hypothetical protein
LRNELAAEFRRKPGKLLADRRDCFWRVSRSEWQTIAVAQIHQSAHSESLGAPGSTAPPAPIEIQLSADMIRASAIAFGHPRLAVINGRTITEGDSVILQGKDSAFVLILRVNRIGDGAIELPTANNCSARNWRFLRRQNRSRSDPASASETRPATLPAMPQ